MQDLLHGEQKMLNGFFSIKNTYSNKQLFLYRLNFHRSTKSISKFGSSFILAPKLSSLNCLLYFKVFALLYLKYLLPLPHPDPPPPLLLHHIKN